MMMVTLLMILNGYEFKTAEQSKENEDKASSSASHSQKKSEINRRPL
jgi:hypothetical protein